MKRLKLKELEEFGGNPQKMSRSEFNGLVESLKRNGWLLDAPVVWEYEENKYKIISGHHRVRAAIQAGIEETECKVLKGIDEKLASLLVIEANQRKGKFDNVELDKFVDDINIKFDLDFTEIFEFTGFEKKEFEYSDFVEDVKEKILHDLICPKCGFKWEK